MGCRQASENHGIGIVEWLYATVVVNIWSWNESESA